MIRKAPKAIVHGGQTTSARVGETAVITTTECDIGLWNKLMIDLGYVALGVVAFIVLFGELSWKGAPIFKGVLAK